MAEGTASLLALAFSPPFNIQGDPAGRLFFLASGLRGAGVEAHRYARSCRRSYPVAGLFRVGCRIYIAPDFIITLRQAGAE